MKHSRRPRSDSAKSRVAVEAVREAIAVFEGAREAHRAHIAALEAAEAAGRHDDVTPDDEERLGTLCGAQDKAALRLVEALLAHAGRTAGGVVRGTCEVLSGSRFYLAAEDENWEMMPVGRAGGGAMRLVHGDRADLVDLDAGDRE